MTEPAPVQGILDRIGRNITVLGSIIAALVGVNTALTTCSAQTVARHQTFRQAVEAEEVYWRNLYADYLRIFEEDTTSGEREARLFALSVLAQRDIPRFEEYSLGLLGGGDAKRLAYARLTTLKRRLNEVLARPESSTPQVAALQQEQAFAAALGAVRTAGDRQNEDLTGTITPDQAQVASGVNYLPQILASGSKKGWDIDVFWCGGGGPAAEAANYNVGLAAARALADLAAGGTRLGGDTLGRVRLVMLPEARQGGIYPVRGSGREIRAERSPAEQQFAAAVRAQIPAGNSWRTIASDTPSRWYLSLFSCGAGQAPAGRTPNAGFAPQTPTNSR